MKHLLLFIFLIPLALSAQERDLLNFELKVALSEVGPEGELPVYLRGDVEQIVSFIRGEKGVFKGAVANIVSCTLPVEAFSKLGDQPYITFVEYSLSRPNALGDMMIQNNNVLPVHQGIGNLPESYKGQDVIIGLIDTGIELAHPDFQHEDGSTRVIAIWDQTQPETFPFRVPQPYGYGQEWNAEEIDAGITGHADQATFFGHGSTVSGVAVGNANATGDFIGVAPEADIIVVSSDFNALNWKSTVAESVEWIFAKAAEIGKPVVINASLGDYYGSHDALDAPALFIESMLDAAAGRAMVAAAGNSDQFPMYHLGYEIPESDTVFTWFQVNQGSALGVPAVFFEFWTDVADFQNAKFTIGADLMVPTYVFRGYAGWRDAASNLDQIVRDTIFYNSSIIGIVDSWCGHRDGQYQIQMVVTQPFSTQYRWRFATTGGGHLDCWSHAPFGSSAIVSSGLPDVAVFPDIANYKMPDKSKTIVDSWTCSDKVITVGNYVNRESFLNYQGTITEWDVTQGTISENCSRGPTRDVRQKPDIAASGDITLSAGRIATINSMIATNSQSLAFTGMHYSNGGTSMASPVVAGVAALYFDRCPLANWADLKNALLGNALADLHTGVLPGYQFGHGKTDAFGTIASSVTPIPMAPLSYMLCAGSSLTITAPAGYSSYTWNEGTESMDLTLNEGGQYVVQATDAKGCVQESETIVVVEIPIPPTPVIVLEGEALIASGTANAWQWYLNGNPVSGANQQVYTPMENGFYQVEAIGENDCSAFSDAYSFIVSSTEQPFFSETNVFPNPTAERFRITGIPEDTAIVQMMDISGRQVLSFGPFSTSGGQAEVDVSTLKSGMYVVRISLQGGNIFYNKLVVEK